MIMTNWINITAADMDDVQLAAVMTALRSEALGSGQADPFDATMQTCCNYIRNRISGRVNISATPYSVPPELKGCATLLILEALSTRLSMAIQLTEDQIRRINRAYKDLDIAGTSELPVTTATDAITPVVQAATGGVSIVKKPSRASLTRESMEGL